MYHGKFPVMGTGMNMLREHGPAEATVRRAYSAAEDHLGATVDGPRNGKPSGVSC
jgi:hypothetical protein